MSTLEPASSAGVALRLLRRGTGLLSVSLDTLVRDPGEAPPVVVFADFFAGTGEQAVSLYEEARPGLDSARPEVAEAPRILLLAAATTAALKRIRRETGGRLLVCAARELDATARAFHTKNKSWKGDDAARTAAEAAARRIGEQLDPQHPLGFGDCELLLAFFHNCPNNTLPVIWKEGRVDGTRWFSLFPRR